MLGTRNSAACRAEPKHLGRELLGPHNYQVTSSGPLFDIGRLILDTPLADRLWEEQSSRSE